MSDVASLPASGTTAPKLKNGRFYYAPLVAIFAGLAVGGGDISVAAGNHDIARAEALSRLDDATKDLCSTTALVGKEQPYSFADPLGIDSAVTSLFNGQVPLFRHTENAKLEITGTEISASNDGDSVAGSFIVTVTDTAQDHSNDRPQISRPFCFGAIAKLGS